MRSENKVGPGIVSFLNNGCWGPEQRAFAFVYACVIWLRVGFQCYVFERLNKCRLLSRMPFEKEGK